MNTSNKVGSAVDVICMYMRMQKPLMCQLSDHTASSTTVNFLCILAPRFNVAKSLFSVLLPGDFEFGNYCVRHVTCRMMSLQCTLYFEVGSSIFLQCFVALILMNVWPPARDLVLLHTTMWSALNNQQNTCTTTSMSSYHGYHH